MSVLETLAGRIEMYQKGRTPTELAAAILLDSGGLLIVDVTKHEPMADRDTRLLCMCGWQRRDNGGESYFDHIGASHD